MRRLRHWLWIPPAAGERTLSSILRIAGNLAALSISAVAAGIALLFVLDALRPKGGQVTTDCRLGERINRAQAQIAQLEGLIRSIDDRPQPLPPASEESRQSLVKMADKQKELLRELQVRSSICGTEPTVEPTRPSQAE